MYDLMIQSTIENWIGLTTDEAKWIRTNKTDEDVKMFYTFFDLSCGNMNPYSFYQVLSYLNKIRNKIN